MNRIEVVALSSLGFAVLLSCRREPSENASHDEEAAPFTVEHAPSGESIVVLTKEARDAAGIETATPVAREIAPEVAAYGALVADPARGATLRAPLPGTIVADPDATKGWPSVGARVASQAPLGRLAPRTPPLTTAEVADLASRLAVERGEVTASEAEAAAAGAALKRARELNQLDKGVSDQAVEAAVAAEAAAQSKLAAAKASVTIFEKAASAAGSVQLEPIPLLAPREGEVTAVLVQPGEHVEAGAELLRVADFRELFVDVRLPAGSAAPPSGAKARVVVNGNGARDAAHAAQALVASVVGLAPEGGALAPTLRLRLADPSGSLRPGLGVTAWLAVDGGRTKALALPASALLRYASRTWIYVEIEEGRFARRAVAIARAEGDSILVASGLEPDAKVVTVGATLLLSQEQIAAGGSEGE